jgi:hypothetical protein
MFSKNRHQSMTSTEDTMPWRETASPALDRLAARIGADGSLGENCTDLACFHKLPDPPLHSCIDQ